MLWPRLQRLKSTVYPAWIAIELRSKLGVAPIPIILPRTRLSRRCGSFSTRRSVCGSRKCNAGETTMRGIDEPMVLELGERTSLRQLATEGRLTLRWSGSDPASKTRTTLGADVRPGRGWEINEQTYAQLKALGVPEEPMP
jgi:hypothetical protein